jgi:FlaA1/EpsC-like NDP-sugar epimerase
MGRDQDESRAVIVGAGAAGRMVAEEMRLRPEHGYRVVGFLDDDPGKQGREISDIPVLGSISDLCEIIKVQSISEIVIAMPSASGRSIREVVKLCEEAGTSFKIVPGVWEIILGDVTINQLREVRPEDLLGRETVSLDQEEMIGYLAGKRVLVTGAGGSIGSELARQVAAFSPGHVLLMGRGENSIYAIDQEIGQYYPYVKRSAIISSISDAHAVENVFRTYRPQIVFHAAAHKHVHLMQAYPDEAIKNNVIGTRILVDAAVRYGAERLVMLSTDKAVRPRGAMGASKRLAESILVERAAHGCDTKLMAVRFGNVLASRGSVVPLFRQQIRLGGPVTVTHPDVTRYFMTIREAALLVLEAGLAGHGGEVFVLDMGEPIRIADLAAHLIRLSGLEPGKDIAIEFCGLRPGEKLHEELWYSDETLSRTSHDKVMVVQSPAAGLVTDLEKRVARLEKLARVCDRDQILGELADIFPDMETGTKHDKGNTGS